MGALLRNDEIVVNVAQAYQRLDFGTWQRVVACLKGEQGIAQTYETAKEIVASLSAEDLAWVLTRLLVTSDDRDGVHTISQTNEQAAG